MYHQTTGALLLLLLLLLLLRAERCQEMLQFDQRLQGMREGEGATGMEPGSSGGYTILVELSASSRGGSETESSLNSGKPIRKITPFF